MLLGALLVFAVAAPVAAHDDLDENLESVKAEIDRVSAQIDQSGAQQGRLASDIVGSRDLLSALVADRDSTRADLTTVQGDLKDRRDHLALVQDQLVAHYEALAYTRSELEDSKEATAAWARELYMTAGGFGATDLAFAVAEINELAIGMEYLDTIARRDERAVSRLEALEVQEERQQLRIEQQQAEVEAEVAALATIEADLAELTRQLESRTAEVDAEVHRQETLLAQLRDEEEHFRNDLEGLAAEQDKLESLIAERQTSSGSAPGILLRPVPGRISSGFGYRLHPILGTQRLHTGVDMSGGYGTTIVAAGSGTVIHAGWFGGYGNAVIIDHGGGMATLYAHQSSVAVSRGQSVSAGQIIGYIGSTGLSTGPHLHFEVRLGGTPVDPVPYF